MILVSFFLVSSVFFGMFGVVWGTALRRLGSFGRSGGVGLF